MMKEVIVKMADLVQIMRLFVLQNVDLVLLITVILRVKHLVVVICILIQMVSTQLLHMMMKHVTMVVTVTMVPTVHVILLSVQTVHSNVDLVHWHDVVLPVH